MSARRSVGRQARRCKPSSAIYKNSRTSRERSVISTESELENEFGRRFGLSPEQPVAKRLR
jgi:hypothetical protein